VQVAAGEARRAPGALAPLAADLTPAQAALAQEMRTGRDRSKASLQELAAKTFSSKATVSRWLNGRGVPTPEQGELWAAFCDTDPEVLRRLIADAAKGGPADPAVGQEDPPSPGRRRRTAWMIGGVALLGVIVLLAVLLRDNSMRDNGIRASGSGGPSLPPAQAQPTCDAYLDLPPDSSIDFDINVSPGCPPPPGRQRWIVVQLDEVGHDKHTLYYLLWRINYPTGPYRLLSKPAHVGTPRTYFVIEVTDQEYQRLVSSRQTNDFGLFELSGVSIVSNRAPNTRTKR
jgi:hypothetical protein